MLSQAWDRLRATGSFKRVTLRVEPLEDDPDRVELVVEVVERSTVSISDIYLGGSALTPFRGGIALAERNFLGRGVLLGGALIWGTQPRVGKSRRQQAYKAFAEAPRLRGVPVGILVSSWFISASEPYRVEGAEDDEAAGDVRRAGGEAVHARLEVRGELGEVLSAEDLELVERDDEAGER